MYAVTGLPIWRGGHIEGWSVWWPRRPVGRHRGSVCRSPPADLPI